MGKLERMNSALRVALIAATAGLLYGCEDISSLVDDDTAPAMNNVSGPAPSSGPVPGPPDDSFCKGAADAAARPAWMPDLYTPETQARVREREYNSCLSNADREIR